MPDDALLADQYFPRPPVSSDDHTLRESLAMMMAFSFVRYCRWVINAEFIAPDNRIRIVQHANP